MGLLDEIDKLELSDEQKDRLRQEYGTEVSTKDDELSKYRRRSLKAEVDKEIDGLKKLGFSESPGLLKFVRRVLLSDDDQPGAVLLSDADLELSGDEAVGARTEEEISVAEAIREFIKLLPRTEEGHVKLADQVLIHNSTERPASEEEESDDAKAQKRQRVEKTLGRPVERKRTRFQGTVS